MAHRLLGGSLALALPLLALASCSGDSASTGGALDGGPDGGGASGGGGGSSGGGGSGGCERDVDCAGGHCLRIESRCVECLANDHCQGATACRDYACTPLTACTTSLDCQAPLVCDANLGVCVECATSGDCGTDEECVLGNCEPHCDSDLDCTPFGKLCDFITGVCEAPATGGTGGGGGSGGGGSGTGGAGGGSGGSGGSGLGGSGGGQGGTDGGGACGTLNYVVLLDRSGSMQTQGRWSFVTSALQTWTTSAASAGTRMALHRFAITGTYTGPSTCASDLDCGLWGPCFPGINICSGSLSTDSCDPADYETPLVALSPLPSPTIGTAIASLTPEGGTPTTAALEGTIAAARDVATAHAGDTTVVVLLTDGEPAGCTVNTVTSAAAVAALGWSSTPKVKTYVVTILAAVAGIDDIAAAGGSVAARAASTDAGLRSILDDIRAEHPCP